MYLILLIIKKYRTKKPLRLFIKKVTSFLTSRSLFFTFDLKRELDSSSFSVLATKLFHIAGHCIDIWNLLLRSLIFGLLQFTLEKPVGH